MSFLWHMLAVLIVITIILFLGKFIKNKSIRSFDLLPPFLMYFIYKLTLNHHGYSILPYIIIIWMLIGIVLTIYSVRTEGDIVYKTFFKKFWRCGDIILFLAWLLSIVLGIFI